MQRAHWRSLLFLLIFTLLIFATIASVRAAMVDPYPPLPLSRRNTERVGLLALGAKRTLTSARHQLSSDQVFGQSVPSELLAAASSYAKKLECHR